MKLSRFLSAKTLLFLLLVTAGAGTFISDSFARRQFEEAAKTISDLTLSTQTPTRSRTIDIEGNGAVAGAELMFFVNDEMVDVVGDDGSTASLKDADGGSFEAEIVLPNTDGAYKINAQQTIRYRDLIATGEKSNDIDVVLDSEAPTGNITLWPDIQDRLNEMTLTLRVDVNTNDPSAELLISNNGSAANVVDNENGSTTIQLNSGDNEVSFFLVDEAGNESEALYQKLISVDAVSPLIKETSPYFCTGQTVESQELVCLSIGQFSGPLYGTAYAPVTGTVKGDVDYLYLNGSRLSVKPDGTINQKVAVYVSPGDNNYDVEARDPFGNIGYGTVSVSWSEDADDSYDYGPTALCNDGTYSYSQNRSGTCSWHGGVAEWY